MAQKPAHSSESQLGVTGGGMRQPRKARPVGRLTRFLGRYKLIGLGLPLVFVVVLCALLAPYVTPYGPAQIGVGNILQAPSADHPLGTDELGRDTLTRVIYGARVSLQVGLVAVGISLVVGTFLGLVSGYAGGVTDAVIMRLMDGLMAFPALVLALGITTVLGPSLGNVMFAIGITRVPDFARLVRGQVLSVRDQDFVYAAQAVGASHGRLMIRHILPNVVAPIIVLASINIPAAIIAEAGLSFLGLGVQPPTPSWGAMINVAKGYIQESPWLSIAPGTAIVITVLGFNFLGDGLRDALDPRTSRHG
jgi:peptide/nickel transport system permease protein